MAESSEKHSVDSATGESCKECEAVGPIGQENSGSDAKVVKQKNWDGADSDLVNLDPSSSGRGSDEPGDDGEEDDDEYDYDYDNDGSGFNLRSLTQYFRQALGFMKQDIGEEEKLLDELSLQGVANYIKSGKCKDIVVMVGAGISTSAGIPDFRSPNTGIYSKLSHYNLPNPEAIFEINYFKENPAPFFKLAKELLPGNFKPTTCHHFLKLLHDEGLLLRLYTQNIDGLEQMAGVPADKVVEAHGTFYTAHCLNKSCRREYPFEWMKEKIQNDVVPTCEKCNTFIKPDIIFFNEALPARFFVLAEQDFHKCDLLIIIGTSLQVQPFASLVDNVSKKTPRLLLNKVKCGHSPAMSLLFGALPGLKFDSKDNYRDVFWQGNSDEGCVALAEALGWSDKLNALSK